MLKVSPPYVLLRFLHASEATALQPYPANHAPRAWLLTRVSSYLYVSPKPLTCTGTILHAWRKINGGEVLFHVVYDDNDPEDLNDDEVMA
eukprot:48357-Eustigmatos_ZCMA.PRE.1